MWLAFQVGSSLWLNNFKHIVQFHKPCRNRTEGYYNYTKHLFPPPLKPLEQDFRLRTSLRLLIVRHPFERIISLYKSVVKNSTLQILWNNYTFTDIFNGKRTFSNFVEALISSVERGTLFGPFSVLNPYHITCSPCNLKYNIIIELNNLVEEQRFVFAKRKWAWTLEDTTPWKHSTRSAREAKIFVQKLSPQERKDLNNIYKLDLEMFNYTEI